MGPDRFQSSPAHLVRCSDSEGGRVGEGDREAVEGAATGAIRVDAPSVVHFVHATSPTLRAGEEKHRLDVLRVAEPEQAHPRIPLGHPAADACLKGGLVTGALHEVFAAETGCEGAASGFAATLAARVARRKKLLWIRQDFSALEFGEISATGFLELGIDPARVLLLRAPDVTAALRATGDALSCAALGAVILEIPGAQKKLDLVTSRRLTLAAARKGVSVFLLRFAAEPDASSTQTRWAIAPAQNKQGTDDWGFARFDAQLTRNRHGATGHWTMEWNSDEQSFGAAHPGAVVSVPGDGPARKTA